MMRSSRILGETPDGLTIRLDYQRDGEVGAFTLYAEDGDALYRVGTYAFDCLGAELCARHDAENDAALLAAEPAEPPAYWAEPLRDDPEALGA